VGIEGDDRAVPNPAFEQSGVRQLPQGTGDGRPAPGQ